MFITYNSFSGGRYSPLPSCSNCYSLFCQFNDSLFPLFWNITGNPDKPLTMKPDFFDWVFHNFLHGSCTTSCHSRLRETLCLGFLWCIQKASLTQIHVIYVTHHWSPSTVKSRMIQKKQNHYCTYKNSLLWYIVYTLTRLTW